MSAWALEQMSYTEGQLKEEFMWNIPAQMPCNKITERRRQKTSSDFLKQSLKKERQF